MDLDGASRNLTVAALLTLSGGYLDAYTYVGHGHVFANTMTGNVALLGINLSAGEWAAALHHVPPLGGFVVAVFVAHLLGLAAQRGWMRHTAFASLVVEIAFLGIAASGLVGASSAWLIPGISFVATLQTLSFTHLEELSYTSVMTTGNLRRAAQKLFVGLIPRYDAGALHDSALLATISFCFLAGAVAGGLVTRLVPDVALWGAVLLLVGAFAEIVRRAAARRRGRRRGRLRRSAGGAVLRRGIRCRDGTGPRASRRRVIALPSRSPARGASAAPHQSHPRSLSSISPPIARIVTDSCAMACPSRKHGAPGVVC
ncbi:YoaK family protein [Burkholderia ubonensis]|uniref:YoaK family protein n=1 Tax=Burkholderia ubonensis TaxID=101571 RepID=UPI0026865C97